MSMEYIEIKELFDISLKENNKILFEQTFIKAWKKNVVNNAKIFSLFFISDYIKLLERICFWLFLVLKNERIGNNMLLTGLTCIKTYIMKNIVKICKIYFNDKIIPIYHNYKKSFVRPYDKILKKIDEINIKDDISLLLESLTEKQKPITILFLADEIDNVYKNDNIISKYIISDLQQITKAFCHMGIYSISEEYEKYIINFSGGFITFNYIFDVYQL